MRGDAIGGEGAELAADHVERLVVEAFVGHAALGKMGSKERTMFGAAALSEEASHRRVLG